MICDYLWACSFCMPPSSLSLSCMATHASRSHRDSTVGLQVHDHDAVEVLSWQATSHRC